MTQKIILPLNGVMNRDASPIYIDTDNGEVFERRNCRIVSNSEGKTHINTSIKSTRNIYTPGNGIDDYVCVGYVEDIKRERGIWFLAANAVGATDKIIAAAKTNDLTTIIVPTTLLSGSYLNFDPSKPIDADIIDDFLCWTDNVNPPCKINMATYNTYPATRDAENIQLAVRYPINAPTVNFGSDSSRKINFMVGRSFQFAAQYIYQDYEYSVLSAYSDIAVSPAVFPANNQTYVDNNVGNYVTVSYNPGAKDVKTIRILAREGNIGNWFIVEETDRPSDLDPSDVMTTTFYNDRARQYLPNNEALALYSDVPLLAKTLRTAQNRIELGNVTKGYDKTNANITYTVEYETVDVASETANITITQTTSGGNLEFGWNLPATFEEGDTISVKIYVDQQAKDILSGVVYPYYCFFVSYEHAYVVQAGDTKEDIQNAFVSDILSKTNSVVKMTYEDIPDLGLPPEVLVPTPTPYANGAADYLGYDIVLEIMGGISVDPVLQYDYAVGMYGSQTSIPSGVRTYKSGAYYNAGIIFYDDRSRTSGVLNPQRIYIPSNGERSYVDAYKQAKIKFEFSSGQVTVPSWATHYRFAVSEAINILSVFPFVTGSNNTNIHSLFLDNKPVFAINIPSNLTYEFNNGDYLVLEADNGVTISTIIKTVMGLRAEILVGTEYIAGNWLIVPQGDEDATDYIDKLAYIYRPKTETSEVIYYETPDTYSILNGVMLTTSDYVGEGDAWFVQRHYQWDSAATGADKVVEDFFVSVDDNLRAYSKGRAVVDFGTLGRRTVLQDVVWSKKYFDNTKINGLAFFDPTDRVQLDEKDGEICRMRVVGDVIKVIQTRKETSLYLGMQRVTNADGSMNLIATGNFVGTVYPMQTDYGSTDFKSVIVHDRAMYYWDGRRGEVIRSSANGQIPISDKKFNSWFFAMKSLLDRAYWKDIVFHFDSRYKELICTFNYQMFQYGSYESSTVVFSELLDGWTYFYDLKHETPTVNMGADLYGGIGERSYAFNYGRLYELDVHTSRNVFFGIQQPFKVIAYLNQSANLEKKLESIMLDSNQGMSVYFESPSDSTKPLGQYTLLYAGSFRQREGLYVSQINRNLRIQGGATNMNLLFSGERMSGRTIAVTFEIDPVVSGVELRMAIIGVVISN